jgi:hypothetical protein
MAMAFVAFLAYNIINYRESMQEEKADVMKQNTKTVSIQNDI